MVMMSGLAAAYSVTTTAGTTPLGVSFQQRRRTMSMMTTAATCRRREAMPAPEKEKADLLRSLDAWAESNLLPLLKPVERSWQPHDLLPDSASPGFREAVDELRARAREIPDDYYVCLVGNMVTEETLPTYHAALNSFVSFDDTGTPSSADAAWARWSRGWTAEENRHSDLLNRYLYLCGDWPITIRCAATSSSNCRSSGWKRQGRLNNQTWYVASVSLAVASAKASSAASFGAGNEMAQRYVKSGVSEKDKITGG